MESVRFYESPLGTVRLVCENGSLTELAFAEHRDPMREHTAPAQQSLRAASEHPTYYADSFSMFPSKARMRTAGS